MISRFSLWATLAACAVAIVILIGAATDTLLYVALFIAALTVAFLLPFLILQIPRLHTNLASSSRAKVGNPPRTWARRVTGLGAMVASPVYGFAFPLAALPAALAVFKKPIAGWPKHAKPLVWWSLAGLLMLVLSAQLQGEPISGNILHYAAMALFVTAAVKLTQDQGSASQLIGFASVGSAMFYVLFRPPNTDTFEHLWKYGLGPYVAIVAVWVLCSLTPRRYASVLALFVIGCASLFLGFRSHGLVCFLALVFVMVQGGSISKVSRALRGIFAFAALYALSRILPFAIESGLFGETVRARTMAQLGDDGPDLLAGRVEPPLSIAAIMERPWFGWGNLNAIDNHTMSTGADIAYGLGMIPQEYMKLWVRSDGRVSLHSVLGEGWAEGGILSAVMPILLLGLFAAAIFKARGGWAPLVILVSIQGVWDVLFSTWGFNRALTLALSAVLAALAIAASRQPQIRSASDLRLKAGAIT